MNAEIRRQVSVAIENQLGRLASVSRTLADRGINLDGVCVIDNIEQGMLRLLPDDPQAVRQVLAEKGLPTVEVDVVIAELPNGVGNLAQIAERLREDGINIEYAYATGPAGEGMSRVVVKTASAEATLRALLGPDEGAGHGAGREGASA